LWGEERDGAVPQFNVKQPDGRYAIFSTIVDNFIAANLTREEAVEHWARQFGRESAEAKVARAESEEDVWTKQPGGTLHRWRDCLRTIESVHGENGLREVLEEMGQPIEGTGR
jgi:hypothetical protein